MTTTTKKKVAPKKKAVAKKVTKKATDDLIVSVAHEVENMDKETAIKEARGLGEDIDFSYFKMGGILARIHTEQWFLDDGFEKFPEYVEATFGVRRSKAFHLIGIYNGLVESGVDWESVKDLGWSKLKELVHVINPKNVAKWVKTAKDMTVLQLADHVKKQQADAEDKGSDNADAGDGEESKKISSMTFKVHDDQKDLINQAVEKAKTEAGTDVQAVALEAVCMNYLAGPSKPKKDTDAGDEVAEDADASLEGLKTYMENFTWEDVLGVFEKIWPDVDLTVETEE